MRKYCSHFNQLNFYRAPIWPMFMNSIGCLFKVLHLNHSLTGNAPHKKYPPPQKKTTEQNGKQICMIWPIQPSFKRVTMVQQIISYKTILYLFSYAYITLKFDCSSMAHKIITICMFLCTIYCKSKHNN